MEIILILSFLFLTSATLLRPIRYPDPDPIHNLPLPFNFVGAVCGYPAKDCIRTITGIQIQKCDKDNIFATPCYEVLCGEHSSLAYLYFDEVCFHFQNQSWHQLDNCPFLYNVTTRTFNVSDEYFVMRSVTPAFSPGCLSGDSNSCVIGLCQAYDGYKLNNKKPYPLQLIAGEKFLRDDFPRYQPCEDNEQCIDASILRCERGSVTLDSGVHICTELLYTQSNEFISYIDNCPIPSVPDGEGGCAFTGNGYYFAGGKLTKLPVTQNTSFIPPVSLFGSGVMGYWTMSPDYEWTFIDGIVVDICHFLANIEMGSWILVSRYSRYLFHNHNIERAYAHFNQSLQNCRDSYYFPMNTTLGIENTYFPMFTSGVLLPPGWVIDHEKDPNTNQFIKPTERGYTTNLTGGFENGQLMVYQKVVPCHRSYWCPGGTSPIYCLAFLGGNPDSNGYQYCMTGQYPNTSSQK